jgi:hypothetical protein
MTTDVRMPPLTTVVDRPRATYGQNLVTTVLGLWFVAGLMLDAWAHNNLVGLESFFTPWHAVFYVGFAASGAWVCWLVWGNRERGLGLAAVPVGYELAVVGLPAFAVGALGDLVWHTALGIEQSLRILFSPTHLLIVTSMVLIVTSPLRAAWSDPALPERASLRRLLPAVLTTGLATTLVLLFLQYANALVWSGPDIHWALSNPLDHLVALDEPYPDTLAAAIAVTAVVLLAPLLLLLRRWRLPFGTATIMYAVLAGLAGAITEFQGPEILAAVVLAGVGVDVLLVRLRPGPDRRAAFLAFAALAPALTWTLYLGAAFIRVGRLPAVTEYWTGMPVTAGLIGLLLAVVCRPGRTAVVGLGRPDGGSTR